MPVLPLRDLVDIIINLSAKAAARSGFNLAMVVGSSDVISTDDRVKVYSSTDAMLLDGFTDQMPEYKAASLYFMQSTKPSRLAFCRWDEEEETLLSAIRDARSKNMEWYICLPLTAQRDNVLTLAEYIESVVPATMLAYTTSDMELLKKLCGLKYQRTFSAYSNNDYLAVAIVGWAMGANTGLTNSAFTLHCKTLIGIEPDNLDENTLADIKGYNGNCYINRGGKFDLFEDGIMAGGVWFDEILNLDMLANNLQLSIIELKNREKKIPQTEGGLLMYQNAMTDCLEDALRIGFLAPGIWNGPNILALKTGDALPNGYLVQFDSIEEADRENRAAPGSYIALKLAGANHRIAIQMDVDR